MTEKTIKKELNSLAEVEVVEVVLSSMGYLVHYTVDGEKKMKLYALDLN